MTRFRDLREQNKYTQDFVAEQIDVSRITYIRYENGERQARGSELLKLAKLYNVSIDYILGLTYIPNIYMDTKSNPSPEERERAIQLAASALNDAEDAQQSMPEDLTAFSKFVRQIVDQALDERDKHSDG